VSGISCSVGVINLSQPDLDAAKDFYSKVFGKAPDFVDADVAILHFDNTIIKLEKEPAARDRVVSAAVAPTGTGSRVVLGIWVDDVNAACAELADCGISLISGRACLGDRTRS
jgi:catechol 2,3-dioxygenase-like lactoylglutathione lyase family enzyme